jgi:hypothetical protein
MEELNDSEGDSRESIEAQELAALAGSVDAAMNAEAATAEAAQAPAGPALDPELAQALGMIPLLGLQWLRSRIAKDMPEIVEAWPDAVLQAPANAFMPMVSDYLGSLAPTLQQYPKVTMFAVACLPMGLGYIGASMAHAEKRAKALPAAGPEAMVNPAPKGDPLPQLVPVNYAVPV